MKNLGLVLSTSSARESHEWDGFEGGVFSHEIRSGLYGAADADGDGRVSYREIAAFVVRANAAVKNGRFRPDVHARPPRVSDTLVDLRRAMNRSVVIDGKHSGRYFLEDEDGIRVADFHSAPGQRVRLVRPAPSGRVYLRRLGAPEELDYVIPAFPELLAVADLQPEPPRARARGAAHASFGRLFSLPFDAEVVAGYEPSPPAPLRDTATRRPRELGAKRAIGVAGVLVGAAGVATGGALMGASMVVSGGGTPEESQVALVTRMKRAQVYEQIGTASLIGGGAVLSAGIVTLLWPEARGVSASVSGRGVAFGYAKSF